MRIRLHRVPDGHARQWTGRRGLRLFRRCRRRFYVRNLDSGTLPRSSGSCKNQVTDAALARAKLEP